MKNVAPKARSFERESPYNCSHGVFADSEMEILPAGVINLDTSRAVELQRGLVRRSKIRRTTATGVITDAILNRAPVAPVRLNPEVPTKLEDIINRALEKDRELRYQHDSEIRAELKRLKRDTDSGRISSSGSGVVQGLAPETASTSASAVSVRPFVKSSRTKYVLAAVCVALLATAIAAYHFWARSNTPRGPAKITQISQWNRPMRSTCLSPDGHAMAFAVLYINGKSAIELKSRIQNPAD